MTKEEITMIEKLFEEKLDKKLERIGNIEKRLEEILVDTSRTKLDVGFVKLNVKILSNTTGVMKLDSEKLMTKIDNLTENTDTLKKNLEKLSDLPKDMKFVKREVEGHTDMFKDLLAHVVSQKEHKELEERVRKLEIL